MRALLVSMLDWLLVVLGVLSAAAAGGLAWRHLHRTSFWFGVGFPAALTRVLLTWPGVAASCGLAKKRRAWRMPEKGVRPRRVTVERPPRLRRPRPTVLGWTVTLKLVNGQVPDDYTTVADRLAHAWRVHAVRVTGSEPGRVHLLATRTDPLADPEELPASSEDGGELLVVRVGMLETGRPWVLDFRAVPHWLNAGATQSGKSNLANAVIAGLAPQPVALVGFDLKGGVEFTPYTARLSALATTRAECVQLLDQLVDVVTARMHACRRAGVRNIWGLPEAERPTPVVVLVDEVAELFLMADKTEKDEIAKTSTALLRLAQLGRAFGVYLFVCGQRIGSDLGPGVTALRAQMTGRICHRVNDPDTATMTLGDLDPAAQDTARAIPADTPGVAVVAGQDGTWHRARSTYVSEHAAETAARDHTDKTPDWSAITGPALAPVASDEDGQDDRQRLPALVT